MITLTREATVPDDTDSRHNWPLRVTATTTDSFPPEIFVYHAGMPGQPDEDVFECVASVQQLAELPVGRPADAELLAIPYYRLDVLEVWCRDALQLETAWEELMEEADMLVENWISASNMSETETYTV
jgi:hypothetical protein